MMRPIDLNSLALGALFAELTRDGLVRRLLELARDEDIGVGDARGDVTSESWSAGNDVVRAEVVAREDGIVCGLACAPMLMEVFGINGRFEPARRDGEYVGAGTCVARLDGVRRDVLTLERTLLNLIGRLSGIATLTSAYVGAMGDARTRLLDTRKTTPGWRRLEKYAVRCGGGWCHRLGLYDAVLLKDNHLAGVPGETLGERIAEASRTARAKRALRFVEAEVDRLDQLEEVLRLERGIVDIVLLDNMDVATLREAVRMRDAMATGLLLEASGGVTLGTIGAIAGTGVDRISVGALTHSARSLDVSLDAMESDRRRG